VGAEAKRNGSPFLKCDVHRAGNLIFAGGSLSPFVSPLGFFENLRSISKSRKNYEMAQIPGEKV
jgi:hypothetical protein